MLDEKVNICLKILRRNSTIDRKPGKSLWLFILYFCFTCFSHAAQELAVNGSVVLKKGEQSFMVNTLKAPMLLLFSNVSGEFAGAEVSYSVVTSTQNNMRTLPMGKPAPQLWINNWNGHSVTITNLSVPDAAKMQLNLYGITGLANKALKNDYIPQAIAQYKTIGGKINANEAYLLVKSPFEEAIFVIMIGTRLYTYTVNGPQEFDNQSDIKMTKNNTLSLSISNQSGKRLLIINASKTATAEASISYRLLSGQESNENTTLTKVNF